MEPIKINVQVNFAADKSLVDLITAVAGRHLQLAPTAVAQETKPEKPAKKAAKPETKPTAEEKAEQPKPEAAKPETKPTAEEKAEQPKPEAAPEPQPEEAPEKEYTAVDVRAAMDRTRKRIEGENYKEKTDSDGYKKWHRVLTAWFKNTAAVYGAEKPSTLPTSDKRAAFIKECDAVFVKDGELTQDLPF